MFIRYIITTMIMFIIAGGCSSERKTESKQQSSSKKDTHTTVGNGNYSFYDFSYTREESQYAVVFTPVLPRDDATVIAAMLEVINTIYGKHLVTNLNPQLVDRYGTNVIKFDGINENFFFLLVKEYSGEVSGFSLWTE